MGASDGLINTDADVVASRWVAPLHKNALSQWSCCHIQRLAPWHRALKKLTSEVTENTEAAWNTVSLASRPKGVFSEVTWETRQRCSKSNPFGAQVEPEVKAMAAISHDALGDCTMLDLVHAMLIRRLSMKYNESIVERGSAQLIASESNRRNGLTSSTSSAVF
jgi:hypothetical protein